MTPLPDLAAIDELAARGARFVGWRWETRNGKPTKPPVDPASGACADTTDPATWGDLGSALAAAEAWRLAGVGFVLDAARDGIVGVDLDGCRDPETGEVAPWARKIVASLRSYAEVSPSGTGIKALCRADPLPTLDANKRTIGKANGTKAPAVEVYTTGRYFCLTGQILDGAPDEIVDATPELERLARWIAKGAAKAKQAPELPAAFVALLERDHRLRAAWRDGAKIGPGRDRSASGLDWSLAAYLRPHLEDGDLEAVLLAYPHGQLGSVRLRGAAATRRIARILAELGPRPREPAGDAEAFPFWRVADMRRLKAPTYVVERVIPDKSRALIIAPSGHYKTMTAIDLALSVAYRPDFHGLAVEPMPVIYVANEDAYGVARQRILGWLDHHGCAQERVVVVPGDLLLSDPATPARILATGAAAFPGERFGVVLDTWDKSVGGDPDKTADVVPAVRRMEELTAGDVCAFVLTLAHTPWSNPERSKGSVTFWASQEARLKVERDEATGKGTLEVLHIKNGQAGLRLEFDYEVHEFGDGGERCTTLIPVRRLDAPEERQPKPARKPGRKLGPNQKTVLDCLAAALVDKGRDAPPARDIPPGIRVVTRGDWLGVATRHLTQAEPWRREQAFDRAVASLAAERFVRHAGEWFWLPRDHA